MEEDEFWDEEEYDDESGQICDYCESFEDQEPSLFFFRCEDPVIEEVKGGCFVNLNSICSDCCTERIYEADCDCESCTIFTQRYAEIRKNEIESILRSKELDYNFDDNKYFEVSKRFPINSWEYLFGELPEELKGGVERDEKDFKIIYCKRKSTKLQFKDDPSGFFIKLKLLDNFKKNSFKIQKYYEKKVEEIVEEGVKVSKWFIVEFQNDSRHLLPEYLIIRMLLQHFRLSPEVKFIYDSHQINIYKKVIERIREDHHLKPLKVFFAQMNLRKKYYSEDGSFIKTKRDEVVSEIKKNLADAKECDANFIIFPEYSFPWQTIPFLRKFSKDNKIWIVGGAERFHSDEYHISKKENAAFIITPFDIVGIQKKNFKGKDEPLLKSGQELKIFESGFGSFSVLVCADFLEDSLASKISEQLDFMIVLSFNKDVTRFSIKAKDRCISNLCYVMINNITEYNEAGVYAPFRERDSKIILNEFPYFELNLTEFRLHRRRIEKSVNYKDALSETLYDYETSYFKFY